MNLTEARSQFIQLWGGLASAWGVTRTMAQVHALLLIAPDSLTTDDIMEALQISRGSTNMVLHDLMAWRLIDRQSRLGERKDYYVAEKEIWKVATLIVKERRRRELEPVLEALKPLLQTEGDAADPQYRAFMKTVTSIHQVANRADRTIEAIYKAEETWLFTALTKVLNLTL
jgi:DNA-binding transcriptional regulator GbsR (MarR family)